MPVSDANKTYQKNIYKWELVRNCCEGSTAVKSVRNEAQYTESSLETATGTLYLPAPNPSDESKENRLRYQSYKQRANYVNFTGHTKDALIGMICRQEPKVEVPSVLLPMTYNTDGMGNSIYTVIKRSLDEILQTAREGLLVDYPSISAGLNARQTEGINPTIKNYCAESVINWKTKTINGQETLHMVVLKEEVAIPQDEFTDNNETQYRVLMLTEEGFYAQRMYNENGELLIIDEENGLSEIYPRQANGQLFNFIPFVFLGATNNDPEIDKSPLYDLAEVNIAHYRNSADYEESCFMVGQPTPVMAGLTQQWVDDVLHGSVMLGSRAFVALPAGGSATLLQASPNQMPLEGMVTKEKQMIQIGAKIITDGGGVETAEAARIRFSGQNSKLATIVNNVEQAYIQCLEWSLLFLTGSEEEIDISLNKEFYEKGADPQMIMAQIQMLDRSVISMSDVRNYLRTSGAIDNDRTDDEIEEDIENTNPLGKVAPIETTPVVLDSDETDDNEDEPEYETL
tara:strand:+ start:14200 stop:15741 length:1542 start_codon:yes stop_codon:yes gene_type:complete